MVVHCADSEAYGHTRIRLLLAEPTPLIVGYDGNLWARTFDYHAHDVELAFHTIEAVRANTVALLRRLPDGAFDRVGTTLRVASTRMPTGSESMPSTWRFTRRRFAGP